MNKKLIIVDHGMDTFLLADMINRVEQEGLTVVDKINVAQEGLIIREREEKEFIIKKIEMPDPNTPFIPIKEDERERRNKLMKDFKKFKRKRK